MGRGSGLAAFFGAFSNKLTAVLASAGRRGSGAAYASVQWVWFPPGHAAKYDRPRRAPCKIRRGRRSIISGTVSLEPDSAPIWVELWGHRVARVPY